MTSATSPKGSRTAFISSSKKDLGIPLTNSLIPVCPKPFELRKYRIENGEKKSSPLITFHFDSQDMKTKYLKILKTTHRNQKKILLFGWLGWGLHKNYATLTPSSFRFPVSPLPTVPPSSPSPPSRPCIAHLNTQRTRTPAGPICLESAYTLTGTGELLPDCPLSPDIRLMKITQSSINAV